MKKEKKRFTEIYWSVKEYAVLLFILAAFNGVHMWIYQIMYKSGFLETNTRTVINILMLYVMIMAAIATAVIGLLRYRSFIDPMKKLSKAAGKIANGDFSVRIQSSRKNKKKNLVDVLYNDFNTMAEELSSIETMKNDFIANVSHEIKTPLSIIQSYTIALQDKSLQENERTEYTQTILEASQKLSILVTNILKLSKLENQEILSCSKPFDLGEQLRRCILAFDDLLEQKNIRIEDELDEVSVSLDENMLEIIWNNLLSNAIKFTNPGGTIFISQKIQRDSARDFVQISITDTGCGMDKATQKRIFDKFYQGDTSHAKEGNGLGLALVKKTVDLLGGTITVDSTPGHGSTFTVCLNVNDLTTF